MTEQAFTGENAEFLHSLCADYQIHNSLTEEAKNNSNIKRGLRNDDGTGVMIGCTKVGNVLGYRMVDGSITLDVPPDVAEVCRRYLCAQYCREQHFVSES